MTVDTSYLVGNPAYKGGSPQPTMGTVDPTGYVDRALNNPTTAAQPSDSRSGLAAAAINGTNQPVAGGGTSVTPAGTVTPTRNSLGQYFNAPQTSVSSAIERRQDMQQAAQATAYHGGPVGVVVTYPNGQTFNEFYTPKSQQEYNQLAQNGWKYNVTADMSSLMQSPQVQQGLDALTSSELTQRNSLAQALQNRLSQITQGEAQTQEQVPQELAANRANFGGRGMLYSTGFANSEQNMLDAVARRMANFEQQGNDAKVSNNTQLQNFLSSLAQKRVGLAGQQAEFDNKQLQDGNVRAAIEKQLGLLGGTNVKPGQPMPKPVVPKPVVHKPAPKPVHKPVVVPKTLHKTPTTKAEPKHKAPTHRNTTPLVHKPTHVSTPKPSGKRAAPVRRTRSRNPVHNGGNRYVIE